jgi:rare lipoprotein A
MRLPVEKSVRLVRGVIALSLAGSLAACGMLGGNTPELTRAAPLPANGPQSDYPVLIGDPYQIGAVTYRPADTMNSDEVGYLTVDPDARGYTGAHHTLPVPSYAEVTSLTTGRTILVRLERRGPMTSDHVLALSPAALAQLDATAETPVRVRRVNPPEEQRLLLRNGQSVAPRMDTPMSLVTVLRRRLPAEPTAAPAPVQAPMPAPVPETVEVADVSTPAPNHVVPPPQEPARAVPPPLPPLREPEEAAAPPPPVVPVPAEPVPAPPPAPVTVSGGFVVQAAAFSTEERARRAAEALGGTVTRSGSFWRVRTGPFPTRAAAEASLANVRAAGYSDARIFAGD